MSLVAFGQLPADCLLAPVLHGLAALDQERFELCVHGGRKKEYDALACLLFCGKPIVGSFHALTLDFRQSPVKKKIEKCLTQMFTHGIGLLSVRQEQQTTKDTMKAEIKGTQLVITIDMQEPAPSASGKTLVVASSHGNMATTAQVNGKPVIIGLNCYIKR